jgi:AraC-like DNA-binding protein
MSANHEAAWIPHIAYSRSTVKRAPAQLRAELAHAGANNFHFADVDGLIVSSADICPAQDLVVSIEQATWYTLQYCIKGAYMSKIGGDLLQTGPDYLHVSPTRAPAEFRRIQRAQDLTNISVSGTVPVLLDVCRMGEDELNKTFACDAKRHFQVFASPNRTGSERLQRAARRVYESVAYNQRSSMSGLRLRADTLNFLLFACESLAGGQTEQGSPGVTEAEARRLDAAAQFLGITDGSEIGLGATARRFGFSRSAFCEKFRTRFGQTPAEYRRLKRLEVAAELLCHSDRRISDISSAHGFSSASNFSRCFASRFGCAPTAYRERAGLRQYHPRPQEHLDRNVSPTVRELGRSRHSDPRVLLE